MRAATSRRRPICERVIKGVLRDHLGIGERVLAQTVFPDSAAARPMKGLIA